MSFGEAFVDAYNQTSQTIELRKRTALQESAEKRAQEKHQQEKDEYALVGQLSEEIGRDLLAHQQRMTERARASNPPQVSATPSLTVPPANGTAPPLTGSTMATATPPSPEPSAITPVQRAGLTPPDGVGQPAPAPPPTAVSAGAAIMPPGSAPQVKTKGMMNYADHIDAARETVNTITPKFIRLLARAHPVEAAKYATLMANSELQDRMVKHVALAGLVRTNASDPAVPALIRDTDPTYVEGSYKPLKPDPQGNNGYAQYTRRREDGSLEEVGITPAYTDMLLTSTLSAEGILGQDLKAKTEKREGDTAKAQIEDAKARREHATAVLDQQIAEYKGNEPLRKSQIAENYAQAASAGEGAAASRQTRGEAGAAKAVMRITGFNPSKDEIDPAARERFNDVYSAMDYLASENNIPLTEANASRLGLLWTGILSGNQAAYPKDGKWYLNAGDPGKPIRVPNQLIERLQAKPQPKGLQK